MCDIKDISMKRYIPKRPSSIEDSSNANSVSVLKGGSDALRVDYKEIERIIASLRTHYNDRLDLLDRETKKNIETLDKTIILQYNTDSYPDLFALVQKYFSDVKEILPNTVGSYCYGCQQVKGFDDIGCAATCVNGIPPPKLPDWAKCDHTVLLITRKEGHNYSTVLNSTHNKSHAYVFIVNLNKTGISKNLQLTAEEHLCITKLGIKRYHLFEYKNNKHYDISKGIVNVNDTFNRKDESKTLIETYKKVKQHTNSKSGFLAIFLIIILIIIILALAANRYRR